MCREPVLQNVLKAVSSKAGTALNTWRHPTAPKGFTGFSK